MVHCRLMFVDSHVCGCLIADFVIYNCGLDCGILLADLITDFCLQALAFEFDCGLDCGSVFADSNLRTHIYGL